MTGIVKNLISPLGNLLFKSKKPGLTAAQPAALPEATRDVAAEQQAVDDELRRRKGSAADILSGVMGAEAAANQTGKLVVGN
jgi:hypothetical protein